MNSAVVYFSRWIKAKMAELDEEGKPVNRLSDLLQETQEAPDLVEMFRELKGNTRRGVAIRKAKTKVG